MSALALQSFGFEGQTVRAMERFGMPWFVAQDVCACLEIANHRNVVAALDDDEKGVHSVDTLGGLQEVSIISESGVYALVFRSRKPAALRFRKWVTSEVLPALRQTGKYEIIPANDQQPIRLINVQDEPEIARACVAVVREGRRIFGRAYARRLWHHLGLPEIPQGEMLPLGHLPEEVDSVIRQWLEERCEPCTGARTRSNELYYDFCEWAASNGHEPWKQLTFGKQLTRAGFEPKHSGNTYRLNIRLKD